MRKSTASSLLAILALALVLRLSPLTRFVYFGSDVGEYFRISSGLAATGHPIPASVGELLAFAALLLWLRLPRDPRVWWLLVPVTLALVVTHHLTAYFLIVMLLIGLFVISLVRPTPVPGVRARAAYIGFLIAACLAYWLGYATTFRTYILTDVDVRPWWLPLAGLPVLVAVLAGVVLLRRRSTWRYRPRYPSLRRSAAAYGVALGSIYAIMTVAVVSRIPGTTVRLSPDILWYFLPFFAFLALCGAGRKHMDFARHGLESGAWFVGLVLSAAFGALAAARVIIPY